MALTPDGPMRFSATGEATPLDGGSQLMCEGPPIVMDYVLPWQRDVRRRMGGKFGFPCDAQGKRLPGALTSDLLQAGAVAADDGTYVIVTKQGMFGYRVS